MPKSEHEKESETNEYQSSRGSKFRFKKSPPASREGSGRDSHRRSKRSASPSSFSKDHRSRRRRRKSTLKDDPSAYDDSYLPNSRSSRYIDPDEAFRESLFDALADDEGAAYWEGVYGQPIHTFPNTKVGEKGELEEMTDEEYADHVRTRMWEKSHQHILEERARREKAREKQREEDQRRQQDNSTRKRFDTLIDEALKSGDKRRRQKVWKDAWAKYTEKWTQLLEHVANEKADGTHASAIIPWPVESGRRKDVDREAVEEFFDRSPEEGLPAIIKLERVRWHPDKMQQRFRGTAIDADVLQSVTAVFQIVDSMWGTMKKPS